jgi:glycosyltransferase involved in cell wall biosynthesis
MPSAALSVVMANRNHARYLPRALEAVLSQSLAPREVIVLDDASTDDSLKILERFASRFPTLRIVRNESQQGVTATYNRGFALACGRYLQPIAADDYLLRGFIEKAMQQFGRHPDAGVCTAFGSTTEGEDGPLIVNDPGWCRHPTFFSPESFCRRLRHSLPVSALILRRDAALTAGSFRPELAWYSDWFMDLVVAFRHGLIHLPETLGIHVVHADSYSSNARSGPENIRALGALLDCLISPEFADVALFFRRNGVACHLGIDLFRAAASRPDRLDPRILGLLTGFAPAAYERLAQDGDPAVGELARVFLQSPWRDLIARRADLEAENGRLIEEIQLTRLRTAPPGAIGKLRWAAGLMRRRIRRAVGLHPAGRFRVITQDATS